MYIKTTSQSVDLSIATSILALSTFCSSFCVFICMLYWVVDVVVVCLFFLLLCCLFVRFACVSLYFFYGYFRNLLTILYQMQSDSFLVSNYLTILLSEKSCLERFVIRKKNSSCEYKRKIFNYYYYYYVVSGTRGNKIPTKAEFQLIKAKLSRVRKSERVSC